MAAAGDLDLRDADDPGGATKPTDLTGEDFAYKVSALVVAATELAGNRLTPGQAGLDTYLRDIVADVAAIGTAYRIRWSIYTRTRNKADLDAVNVLLAQWEGYMGKGTAARGILSPGASGTLGVIIGGTGSVTTSGRILSSDISKGFTTVDTTRRTPPEPGVAAPFQLGRVD